VQPVLPSAEAASDAQQTQPQPAGGGKKEKELQRKERQRQRKMDEAWEALQVAIEAMLAGARCVGPLWLMCTSRLPGEVASMCGWQGALTCGGVCGCSGESALGALEEATVEAEKHRDRSERLSALVAEARAILEQAKTKQEARARAAAEEAAAAVKAVAAEAAEVVKAAAAVERLQLEERLAALALEVQQVRAQLGSSSVATPAAPHPNAEETLCVVCFDAPKDHIIVPCYHLCVCEACANLPTQMDKPTCPICRSAIQQTNKVFQS
jgi:hypothetical protein